MAFYKATMEDLNTVVEMIQDIIEKQYPEHYNSDAIEFLKQQYARNSVREIINNDMVIIQTELDRVMAIGSLSYDVVSALFVHQDYQRVGNGERLLKKLEEKARDNGQSSIRVETPATGKGFFERMGYKVSGKKTYPMDDGRKITFDVMEKEI